MKALNMNQTQMASQIGRSRKVVRNYLRDPVGYGTRSSGGRPRKLSSRSEREIVRRASNSMASAADIKADLDLEVLNKTILRAIHRSPNLKREKIKTAPTLTATHISARLDFARNNMARDWKKVRKKGKLSSSKKDMWALQVIFSDEKKFNLDGLDGVHSYWRDLRREPRYFSRRNFGGGSVMCWAAFSSFGTLPIQFPSSRMDSQEYQTLLTNTLLPYLRKNRRHFLVYQQDNASVHVSQSTKAWMATNNVSVMGWAARIPDANPMENLWGILVRRVYKNGKQYATVADLKAAIEREWAALEPSVISALVDSMPKRIFDLITRKGHPIDY